MNYWLWFASISKLGPIQKRKLLEVYNTPKKIYTSDLSKFENEKILMKGVWEEIQKSKNKELLYKYEKYIDTHNIVLVNIDDSNYPNLLKEIYDPPITLFCKGRVELLNKTSFSIVGCRNATNYGNTMSKEIAYNLASRNIVIVSGLAKGIDASAHNGALDARGDTIAVLGSGVDVPYPIQNIELYKRILENGLILSEYIVGTKPCPGNFPARNRIISGLSNGVLVVEATLKSGSMITIDFALEQGRNVYAVPGNINMQNSEGTNELIKQGAKLVTGFEDVYEDFL